MPAMHANRLLPFVGITVSLLALVVLLRTCSGQKPPAGLQEGVPQAARPDADSPAETLRALSAQVSEMGAGMKALREENAEVLRQKRDIQARLDRQVKEAVQAAERARPKGQERADQGVLDSVAARIDQLSARVAELGRKPAHSGAPKVSAASAQLPVGSGMARMPPIDTDANGYVWTAPFDAPLQEAQSGAGDRLLNASAAAPLTIGAPATKKPEPIPWYTVPENATLVGSTAMTALVGRIPVKGRIQDPWPFKILTGKDNLAANGLTIPNVDGMVWSGTAVGDWTLGCVAGRLDSVTFIFDDGTIQTVSAKKGNLQVGAQLAPQDDRHLGWISDRFGNPCVSGKRITNAPSWLAQRTGLAALQAAGEAAAAGETTSTVSPLFGTSTSTVTGDVGTYIAGKGISGGADEVDKWINERMGQSFDAIFRAAGAEVAIHVDQEIPIDYKPDGRRLSHAQGMEGDLRGARLD